MSRDARPALAPEVAHADAATRRQPPTAQTSPVLARDGREIRPSLAVKTRWRDPENQSAIDRSPREVIGYHATDCLIALNNKGKGDVTILHIIAAGKFRDAYELGEMGARPGYERPEIRSSSSGGMMPPETQLDALADLRAARDALGSSLCAIVDYIVLGIGADPGKANLKYWSEKRAERPEISKGRLLAALDRLTEHYGVSKQDMEREVL